MASRLFRLSVRSGRAEAVALPLASQTDGLTVTCLAACANHAALATAEHGLFTLGSDEQGQLAHDASTIGFSDDENCPPQLVDRFAAGEVSGAGCGLFHTLAIGAAGKKKGGGVFAWGNASWGQLGRGQLFNEAGPVPVLAGVRRVACGGAHSLVLLHDGSVRSFGNNREGQLGHGDTMHRLRPTPIESLAQFGPCVELAAGLYHSLALSACGEVLQFGSRSADDVQRTSAVPPPQTWPYPPASAVGFSATTTPKRPDQLDAMIYDAADDGKQQSMLAALRGIMESLTSPAASLDVEHAVPVGEPLPQSAPRVVMGELGEAGASAVSCGDYHCAAIGAGEGGGGLYVWKVGGAPKRVKALRAELIACGDDFTVAYSAAAGGAGGDGDGGGGGSGALQMVYEESGKMRVERVPVEGRVTHLAAGGEHVYYTVA